MSKNRMPTVPFTILLISTLLIQSCSSPRVRPSNGVNETKAGSHAKQDGSFEVTPLIGNFKVRKAVLTNGLKVIVVQDSSSPTFAYQTWFNVGSRNEVIGKTGLAHLFEHMMFKGTKNHKEGQFDALLEGAGVEGENAYTSNDHTVYIQELPRERLDLIVGLESDRMVNLIVDDNSFKTEREVVQNERRFRKENSAEGTLYQTLFETVFTNHPYHWPVIGYEQDLNIMNAQDARDFYERYYSPDKATIIVVGDVNPNEVLRKIDRAYGAIPAKNTPDPVLQPDPDQTAQRRKRIPLNIENEKLWMAYRTPPQNSPDAPAFEVIQELLTDGMNSRLIRALVDTGIATNASSGSMSLKDPGMFVVMIDLQKGKQALLAETIIQREIERLKKTPVSIDELNRAKNLYRFQFLERLSTSSGIARFIGDAETAYGNYQKGIDFQDEVKAVTPEQIQAITQKYFNTQNLTVLVGTPKKGKE